MWNLNAHQKPTTINITCLIPWDRAADGHFL